ncbi:hypothetical protein V8G54_013676 [Vigna mungo]|uniref:DhaK domain-containing protein n=1 Tax=Vigna mungo TaxID=3915 RepID=A0AAQ3NG57_VIGMU
MGVVILGSRHKDAEDVGEVNPIGKKQEEPATQVVGAAAAAGLSLSDVAADAKHASEIPVNVVVSHVLQQILSTETNFVPITRGERVVLMVNGLGGSPTMELMIIVGKTVPKLQLEHGLAVDRVYTGSFMTSLDMAGNHPPAKIPVPISGSRSAKTDEGIIIACADSRYSHSPLIYWEFNWQKYS